MILLDASGLAASRPGRPLFADVSVTIESGDRLAVVGLNGSGKSTLLRQLAGRVEPEAGVVRRGRGSRIVVLDQDAPLTGATIGDVTGRTWDAAAILDKLDLGGRFDEPPPRCRAARPSGSASPGRWWRSGRRERPATTCC